MLPVLPARLDRLLLLGAHCDDIALGAAGTLLSGCREFPGVEVTALVLSGGETERADEERAALTALCPKADLDVTVLDIPDGRLPAYWERAKEALEDIRHRCDPDLIVGPACHDAHQDHRGLARLIPTAFRNHLTLGYEILKWDADLHQPQAFVPMDEELLTEKIAVLFECYPSQRGRSWFDAETFAALARIRGVQCQTRYAEAFHVSKFVLTAGRPGGTP